MKQWISLLLALVLSLALALPAGAAPPEQEEAAAWQLYYMGLFQGTDTDAAAIKAIDKIVHYLPQAVANGDYMKARSMALAITANRSRLPIRLNSCT